MFQALSAEILALNYLQLTPDNLIPCPRVACNIYPFKADLFPFGDLVGDVGQLGLLPLPDYGRHFCKGITLIRVNFSEGRDISPHDLPVKDLLLSDLDFFQEFISRFYHVPFDSHLTDPVLGPLVDLYGYHQTVQLFVIGYLWFTYLRLDEAVIVVERGQLVGIKLQHLFIQKPPPGDP